MAKNKLNDLANGDIWHPNVVNNVYRSLKTDVMGRNDLGAPAPDELLGNSTYQWKDARAKYFYIAGLLLTGDLLTAPANSIIEGRSREDSGQSQFIFPSGTGASFTMTNSIDNLIYKISERFFRSRSDITTSGLTTAPITNNTCLVNSASDDDANETRVWGELFAGKPTIPVDTMGSEITSLIGSWQSFSVNGEYFIAYVESSTVLSKAFRGYYYDSSGDPIPRQTLDDDDVITLLMTAWIFLGDDGITTDVTYNNPSVSETAPGSPATGDYWLDIPNKTWKRYSGSAWVDVDRTFVGVACIDSSDCVGTRCTPFHRVYSQEQNIRLQRQSTTVIRESLNRWVGTSNVVGNKFKNENTILTWDAASNFADAVDTYNITLTGANKYFLYLSDDGTPYISDFEPYYLLNKRGWYHPHHEWRAVGWNVTSSGSFSNTDFYSYEGDKIERIAQYWDSTGGDNSSASTYTWVDIPWARFDTTPIHQGGLIQAVDYTNIKFLKSGWYEIWVIFQASNAIAGSSYYGGDCNLRFYSPDIGQIGYTFKYRCNAWGIAPAYNMQHESPFVFRVKIEELGTTYRFQGREVTMGNNVFYFNMDNYSIYYLGRR